ncbi:MAG: PIN-like domain-containing protein, partial [Pseudomonadota bacterium]
MRDLFPGYYPLSENDIKDIWEKGLFVFDTNVLLSFYRYPIAVREDFFQVLQEISDRVWIPYQVALEFQRNRLNVISKQLKCFDDVRDALDKARKTLSTSFNDLQLKKRHSVINPDYLLSELDELFGGFRGDLLAKEQDQPNFDNDDVRAQLDNIFQGRVGDIPSKEWLESLYNEGKERYKSKTPPGYRDEEKSGKDSVSQFMHRQLVFKREFGDLILWRQITDKASSDNVSGIIFVCDDQKDDWWHSINFRGSKILGPHPELVEEFFLRTNSTSFWIYTSDRFLRFA